VYNLVIERSAEKDMRRLSDDVHDRVSDAILKLKSNPRPHGSKKLVGTTAVGASALGTTGFSSMWRMPSVLSASIAFATGRMFTSDP